MHLRIGFFACLWLAYLPAAVGIAHADGISDINAGLARTAHGEYEAAAQLYTRALDSGNLSEPNKAAAYLDRCNAYDLMGSFDRAIADCSKALQLSPNDADTYADRCAAFNRSGDYGHGIADCSTAIRLDPRNAAAYNNRCNAYFESGDSARAIADCEMAIRLRAGLDAERSPVVSSDRCLIEARLGANEQTGSGCGRQGRPNSILSALYANRGEAYFEAGQFNLAASDFRHVQSPYIGPLRREIWLFLALGRSDRADLAMAVLRNARIPADTWDMVLASFLRGDISASQLRSRADGLRGADQTRATCDALFLINERRSVLNRRSATDDVLQDVSKECAQLRPDEHAIALAELRGSGPLPQRN